MLLEPAVVQTCMAIFYCKSLPHSCEGNGQKFLMYLLLYTARCLGRTVSLEEWVVCVNIFLGNDNY